MAKKSQTGAETMDPKLLSYEDFHPFAEMSEDKDNIILTLHLPDFQKEQLNITCVRASHIIRIKGEQQIASNKWRRFNQSYTVPQNCNLSKTLAKWQNSVLTIITPKENVTPLVVAAAKDQEKTPKEAPKMDVEKQVDDHQNTEKPINKEAMARKGPDETSPQLPQVASTSNDAMNKQAAETKREAEKADRSVEEFTKKETISKETCSEKEKEKNIVDKPEKEAKAQKGQDKTSPQNYAMDKEITSKKDDQSTVSKGSGSEKEKEKNDIVDKEKLCGDANLGEMKRIKDAAMKAVKGMAMENKEERQINMVNVGVAAIVLVGIAAYVSFRIRSKARNN
ncbi:protein RESTRICTED TEV MOVEMENT 2-like [Pistacia vera]|uniref:protein RESTRICTED TEV MOVEMENT 2-like n=1 Tax=Pistacia vera TaxID=55513 RepID=UPI001262F9E9|nr:protein RESTRICTED TEV MOVEMENT 2-like [Pistacia vera]